MSLFGNNWLLLSLAVIATTVNAHQLETHADLSRNAVAFSSLRNSPQVVNNLALDLSNINDAFFVSLRSSPVTIRQVIEDGARSEDEGIRPVTHFYNPISNNGIFTFPASPSWVLEDDKTFEVPLIQVYSISDAHEIWYELLTLPNRQTRLDRAGRFFETLGRAIHHIQDMAQPQHTRGDDHITDENDNRDLFFENPSLFEKWTELNRGRLNFVLPTGEPYPTPAFSTGRQYWHTGDNRGMADYSNRGFVSAGTNFPGSGGFPSPSFVDASFWSVPDIRPMFASANISIPAPCRDPQAVCKMTFVKAPVEDSFKPNLSGINEFASTLSMFDGALVQRRLDPIFSLNRFNFNRANELLIPRAVAYSAGLLDFVFRGKLDAEAAETSDGLITIELTNSSSDGNAFSEGYFELWYDDNLNTRYPIENLRISGAQDATLLSAFDSDTTVELKAPMPTDVTGKTRFLLTFRGRIGQEEGIASVSFQVEPYRTGFAVSLPDGSAGYVTWKNNQWNFISDPDIAAGNIDWRGAYVNGKPTKTLTWSGPTSRYFDGGQKLFTFNETIGEWRPSTFRPYVYENGRLLAVAPGPVLGAAIMQDSLGKEWLVVVTSLGPLKRIVYRRPNERSNSAALYDPVSNPTGWREIGQISATPDEPWIDPRSPWFFNGNGTAAQAMETVALAEDEIPPAKLVRIELRISDEEVVWFNHGNINDDPYWVKIDGECIGNYTTEEDGDVVGSDSGTASRSGRTIVAVDYVDDLEILALMRVEGATNHDRERDDNTGERRSTYESSYLESLIIGAHEFELSRSDITASFLRSADGDTRAEINRLSRHQWIRFLDLRWGVLQVGEELATLEAFADLKAFVGGPQWYNVTKTISDKLILEDSSIISMREDISETNLPFFDHENAWRFGCATGPPWEVPPLTRYWPVVEVLSTSPLWAGEFSLYNGYSVGVKGSVAIDGSGRIFSSQDIPRIPPLPNVTSNLLFGAPGESPSVVIGVGEDEKTLYEPRVIR